MEYTILNNGVKMPMEGFGVFQVRAPKEFYKEGRVRAIGVCNFDPNFVKALHGRFKNNTKERRYCYGKETNSGT